MKDLHSKLLRISAIAAVCLFSAAEASAESIGYGITIDTSSLAGYQGFLDVQFNPGLGGSQEASATVVAFTTDGSFSAAPPATFGPVLGTLPGNLYIYNSAPNDYFQEFTFGSRIFFYVNFFGPALDSPDGSSAGSTFGFGLWDSTGATPLLTTDPIGGFVASVDLNNDGSVTPHNLPPGADGGSPVADFSAAPEPGSWLLAASALAFIAMKRRRV